MEAKLQEVINSLPVIQKAHIYEPRIEDVAETSFKAGIKEMVEIYKRENPSAYKKYMVWWQDKLKKLEK